MAASANEERTRITSKEVLRCSVESKEVVSSPPAPLAALRSLASRRICGSARRRGQLSAGSRAGRRREDGNAQSFLARM